ncbi:HEAT repeat domain-containing protein [Haloarchaeobius sp. DYHT-AS-18]|uniref:HEAT repeat domain-containing protein n=1 Tax=Haloarchaeobius sp. DYHT-AS-18 TaxID=3446117 RepID=UPI003EB7F07F
MTDDDLADRIEAASESDRSFAGMRARARAAHAAATAPPTDTETIEAIAALLTAELDATAAMSERITGLDAIATDIQAACIDALAAIPTDDPMSLEAALPVLGRATHRGRSADVRTAAAERCLHVLLQADSIPADAVPVTDLMTAFEAGESDVRVQLAATRHGGIGNGGVYAAAAEHAPETAPDVVRWLLRFEDFQFVDSRISFERGVANVLDTAPGERATRVLDVVLEHLDHGDADYRRTAAGALADDPEAVTNGRVEDVLDALARRFDDDTLGIQEDAVEAALALLDRVPSAASTTFEQLRADAPPDAVVAGLRDFDEVVPSVQASAIDFLLDASDGVATDWTARRLGEYLAGGSRHRRSAVGGALFAGAAAEAASDDAGKAAASRQLAELTPSTESGDPNRVRALAAVATCADVEPVEGFIALVGTPGDGDVDVDRDTCLRDTLTACLRSARASDATRRRQAGLAVELLVDALQGRDDWSDSDLAVVRDALRAVADPADATAESVAVRVRVVDMVPESAGVQSPSTLAGLLGHADAAVRGHAVELLAAGSIDTSGGGDDAALDLVAVSDRFVDRFADDEDPVREAAIEAAPVVLGRLPGASSMVLIDRLLERAASDHLRTRRRAFDALESVAESVPDERIERIASVALLGLASEDSGTRSVAADLLLAIVPRLAAEQAPAVAAGVVAASESYSDVIFDGLDVLWALAGTPGTEAAVARGFAQTLTASRVARDHLTDASVGFDVTPVQVRRLVDGLVTRFAATVADTDTDAEAITALDVVATALPGDRIEPVVDTLATAAVSEDAAVRTAAFDALESVAEVTADTAPRSTWSPLGPLLVHDRPRVRSGGLHVVAHLIDGGGNPVTAAVRAHEPASATGVSSSTAAESDEGAALRAVLEDCLTDNESIVRVAATRAISGVATESGVPDSSWAIERLHERMTDEVARVRLAAVEGLQDALAHVDTVRTPVRSRLADLVADDPDVSVRAAAVETLLTFDGDPSRTVLDDAAVALRDDAATVRETAVEALPGFVEHVGASLGLRSRIVVHLGERIKDDDVGRVRRAAAETAAEIVASVVDDFGGREPEGDEHSGEWPPTEWVRDALADDSAAVRAAVVDSLPSFVAALSGLTAAVAARYLVTGRQESGNYPTDADLAALRALADRLDPTGLTPIEEHLVSTLQDAEGETASALAVALRAVTGSQKGAANDVVETLLDRIATSPRPTGPFGERLPSPRAEAAREVLIDLVEMFPERFGRAVAPELLTLYVGHERDAVCAAAATVLAAIVEHGENPNAAVGTRDDLRACLAVDDLAEPVRLAVLSLLADDSVLARSNTAGKGG